MKIIQERTKAALLLSIKNKAAYKPCSVKVVYLDNHLSGIGITPNL